MIIACLPSNTTFDVRCAICGRGFLFLTDPTEVSDGATLRRLASAALAAQHNRLKARSDRRTRSDRRSAQPDTRASKLERRKQAQDRRTNENSRRAMERGSLATDQERRTAAPTFRRGSGAAHPQNIFYLEGWDGDADPGAGIWTDALLLQQKGTLC